MDKELLKEGVGAVIAGMGYSTGKRNKWLKLVGNAMVAVGFGLIGWGLFGKAETATPSNSAQSHGQSQVAPGAGIAAVSGRDTTINLSPQDPALATPPRPRHINSSLKKKIDQWVNERSEKIRKATGNPNAVLAVDIQIPMNDNESDVYADEIKKYAESKKGVKVYEINPTSWGPGVEPEHGEVYFDRAFNTINIGRNRR